MPQSIWPDVATIDNKTGCKGCFIQRPNTTENLDTGEINETAICTWEQPMCGCPTCFITCGSQVTPVVINGNKVKIKKMYEVISEGVASDIECSKWYLKESCETC